MSTKWVKSALEMRSPDGLCTGDGYRALSADVERELKASGKTTLSLDTYLKSPDKDSCADRLLKDSKTSSLAKQWLSQIAAYDEQKDSISPFDLAYLLFDLYGENFQEDWQKFFLAGDGAFSALQRIRAVGSPLLDPSAANSLNTKTLLLLRALAVYVGARSAKEPAASASGAIDFYFNQREPGGFADYLGVSLKDFLGLDEGRRSALFAKALQQKFPEAKTVESLFRYFSFSEALDFSQQAFRTNPAAALALFEGVRLPGLRSDFELRTTASGEAQFFPRLSQNARYADRQQAIDAFLGKPVLTRRTNLWIAAKTGASTVLKKHLWPGNTEVFSIESSAPGPTTLVFAPHFHEDNPRKVFHWIKDLPLQSGRLLVIPEANRAMGNLGKDTVRMNRIFNQALNDDAPDYLVVRRAEYLMGLVDGMVGLHDWNGMAPFFISDLTFDPSKGGPNDPGPLASPWLPAQALQIQTIAGRDIFTEGPLEGQFTRANPSSLGNPPQPQWRIAELAAKRLQTLTGLSFSFRASPLTQADSLRANNSTAYMNFFLRKPAMTFEGRKGVEQGRLMAQALYALLLAFGHRVDPSFEAALQSAPKPEPNIYQGLPADAGEAQK